MDATARTFKGGALMDKLLPCPFCGHKVHQVIGVYGLRFFKCRNPECGAVMSFDNDYHNNNPEETIEIYNRRRVDG